jgi:chaperonin GroES
MKIRPIGERVLVKREEIEETSSGGIILTQTHQEMPNQGEVMAVGNVDDVNIGDTVIFGKYSGSDRVQVDGDDLLILELKDIKAVIYE